MARTYLVNDSGDEIADGTIGAADLVGGGHSADTDAHHAQVHQLDGSDHTVSGLTTGHVLQATSATTFGFGAAPAGTPASTVAAETSFGVSSAVGVSTNYAREDHTHGSPTDPVTAHTANASAHHTKYTDAEAITAVEGEATLALTGTVTGVDLGTSLSAWGTLYVSSIRPLEAGTLTLQAGSSTNILVASGDHIVPAVDSSSNLGTTSVRWAAGNFDTVNTTFLSNDGGNVSAGGSILPVSDDAYNLGTSSQRWNQIWCHDYYVCRRTDAEGTIYLQRKNTTPGVTSGQGVGTVFFGAEDNSSSVNAVAAIIGVAAETHTASAWGTDLRLYTTAIGSTSRIARWYVDSEGDFLPYADSSYDIGTSSVRVAVGFFDGVTTGYISNFGSAITLHDPLIPDVDSTHDIGSSSLRIRDVHADDFVLPSGTSFPGSPSTGDKFIRTNFRDGDIVWVYNGTYWLSQNTYSFNFKHEGAAITGSATRYEVLPLDCDVYVTRAVIMRRVASASESVTCLLQTQNYDGTNTSLISSTVAPGTSNAWHRTSHTVGTLLASSAGNTGSTPALLRWTKNSTTNVSLMDGAAEYRLRLT